MPRNGSGTYTLPQAAFVPNTTISSAAVNSDLSDIATAMTASLCTDGQSTMTGAIAAAAGTAAAPSVIFSGTTNTGLYQISANVIGVSVNGAAAGQINSGGFANSAGTNYLTTNPNILQNYITGYTLSNDLVTPNTVLDIAAGQATDSTNASFITLSSAFGKTTGGAWVAGSGNAGMGTGLTIANSTWYHVFAITNAGSTDVYFDTSVTAANKPASTTAFRRIGSFFTDTSAHIVSFTQFEDEFFWTSCYADANGTTVGTSQALITLTVPLGVNVQAFFSAIQASGAGGIAFSNFFEGNQAVNFTSTPTAGQIFFDQYISGGNQIGPFQYWIWTNTSSQVRCRASAAAQTVSIVTRGWCDVRGKK